jgi:hypothetical protein
MFSFNLGARVADPLGIWCQQQADALTPFPPRQVPEQIGQISRLQLLIAFGSQQQSQLGLIQ